MLQLLPPVIEDSIPGNNIFQWGSFVETTSRLDTIDTVGMVNAEDDSMNALIDKLDDIARKTGRSRNELIQMCIDFALENLEIVDD